MHRVAAYHCIVARYPGAGVDNLQHITSCHGHAVHGADSDNGRGGAGRVVGIAGACVASRCQIKGFAGHAGRCCIVVVESNGAASGA